MKSTTRKLLISVGLFILFGIFTVLVKTVDVKDIGPEWSYIGFAAINAKAANFFGQSEFWYKLTELLGILAIGVGLLFAAYGLYELIKAKSFKAVDADIYVLGGFYVLLAAVYALFEKVIINYRPVLEENGELEASYPSSHTVLIVGIMVTAILQLSGKMKKSALKTVLCAAAGVIAVVAVVGRMLAGCHWLTDIAGGILIASALIMLYAFAAEVVNGNTQKAEGKQNK